MSFDVDQNRALRAFYESHRSQPGLTPADREAVEECLAKIEKDGFESTSAWKKIRTMLFHPQFGGGTIPDPRI